MKKLFLAGVLLSATCVSAQIDFSSTRFGALVGGNYSKVGNAHAPSGPRFTMQFGFLGLIPVDANDQFYIQPEVTYYGAGESGYDRNNKTKYKDTVYGNNYISVPLYFKGYFSEAESEFFGMLGPRFNFLVSQTIKNPVRPVYTEEGVGEVNGKANSFNFALSGGLGFSYKRMAEIFVRYDLGLSNTYPNLIEDGTNPDKKKSEQVFSIGLSYILP